MYSTPPCCRVQFLPVAISDHDGCAPRRPAPRTLSPADPQRLGSPRQHVLALPRPSANLARGRAAGPGNRTFVAGTQPPTTRAYIIDSGETFQYGCSRRSFRQGIRGASIDTPAIFQWAPRALLVLRVVVVVYNDHRMTLGASTTIPRNSPTATPCAPTTFSLIRRHTYASQPPRLRPLRRAVRIWHLHSRRRQ